MNKDSDLMALMRKFHLYKEERKMPIIKKHSTQIIFILFFVSLVANVQTSVAENTIITSAPKIIKHKSTATINGSGFGIKNPAAPLKWDDFESGTVGSNMGSGWYKTNRGGPFPKYTNDMVRGVSPVSLKQDYVYSGQYDCLFGLTGLSGIKYYISFYRYMTSLGGPCGNYKPMSFRGGAAGEWNYPKARHDMYQTTQSGHLTVEDCITGYTGNEWTGGYAWPLNSWNRSEYYIELNDVGVANGNYYFWSDGVLKTSINNTIFRTDSCAFNNIYFSGFYARDEDNDPNKRHNFASAYIWHDNVYIDITRARVEMGNASTWPACTHREIQIPSAWSDGSITISVNQGSFTNEEQVYFFVVNENGTASNGYGPLSFEATPTLPKTPHNFKKVK